MLERIMWATFGVALFLLLRYLIDVFQIDRDYSEMIFFFSAYVFGAVRQQYWCMYVSGRWIPRRDKDDNIQ